MADNSIKILISGDPSGLVQASRQVTDSLGRIRDAVGGPAGALPKLDNAIQKTAETLKVKVPAGANQAASALTNVGRVAQDLPFGFVGIQNNLNPLLESFQRLKTETGSGKAALAALGQSLIGAGGVGLALSVVSSAIVIFQNGIAGFNSKTKEAKEKADEFAKSIRSIGLVQQEATAGVEGQIAQVNALATAVSDSNQPYEQRKRALEELKDKNKAYFGDLKLEDAATGALTKTVDEYTKALINNAIQKGFVDEIASVAKAVAKQDDVIRTSRLKLAQAQKAVADAENFLPSGTRDIETARAQKRQEAVQGEKDALENLRKENEKVTALLTQESLVRDQLNKAVLEGTKFKDLDTNHSKKEEDALKKRLGALEKIKAATKDATQLVGIQESIFELQVKIAVRDQGKNNLTKGELDQQIQGFKNELNEAFKNQAIELEAIPKVKFSQVQLADINQKDISSVIAKATGLDKKIPVITLHEARIKINGEKITAEIENKEKIVAQLREQIKGTFEGGLTDLASGLGEGFGEALASADFGEGLKKAAQGILSIVGGVMQQLGRALIGAAIKIKLLKETFEKWAIANPALAIAAGIGLVAAGALIKNIKFDVPKLAKGGIATSATLGIFGEAGKEAIIPLDRLPEMIGRLSMNTNSNVALAPTIRISLTDLELGLERVRSSRRRLG